LDPDTYAADKAALNLADASSNIYAEAKAAHLADASCSMLQFSGPESSDIEEAVMLARKAVRIIIELKGFADEDSIWAFGALFNVFHIKKDFSEETKSLYEEYMSDAIRYPNLNFTLTP
jgi:hypothetical protein